MLDCLTYNHDTGGGPKKAVKICDNSFIFKGLSCYKYKLFSISRISEYAKYPEVGIFTYRAAHLP
jgi:hypothetical protein